MEEEASQPAALGPFRLRIGSRRYDLKHRALVIAVVNRTPDSFYEGARHFDLKSALQRAENALEEGADVVEVGGVKAGPGEEVSVAEEVDRVVPVIEEVSKWGAVVSVDTWRPEVLKEAAAAGALVANDISGFADPEYLKIAAGYGMAVVATHIRKRPREPDPNPQYRDLVGEVFSFLKERIERAVKAGVAFESVVVDAGLDLGKNTEQNLKLLSKDATRRLLELKRPLMVAASRKRFLSEVTNTATKDLLPASLAVAVKAYSDGARIFRVHDVKEHVQALKVASEVLFP